MTRGFVQTLSLFRTRETLRTLLPQVISQQNEVIESGTYILGPEVEAFEDEFADYISCRHCVGVASGTDALTISLRALGVGPGDEVVVPGYSFFATVEAVVHAGANPVFADIDPNTHCLSAETVEPLINAKTRAVIPVHIFGNPAGMGELASLCRQHSVAIVEDAAQAAGGSLAGRMAGSLGDIAAFSFYPGKNLGAFGDAGAIVTNSADLANAARRLRVHGQAQRWIHSEVGYTSRLDAVQATGLRVLLPHLDSWTSARNRAAAYYEQAGLSELIPFPLTTPGAKHAYHLFVICSEQRDALAQWLAKAGIEARAYYTMPLHKQPAFSGRYEARMLPVTERLARVNLALPMGPDLTQGEATRVVEALSDALSAS